MRDIVNSAYNSSTLPAKNNLVRMNSASARGDYRSYRDFLESYGDNKNSIDDQESISSTDSGISAASKYSESESINPSSRNLNNSRNLQSTGSFSNYMENYNNKKFGSVKPATKQNLVKCEIVLQINDPLESSKNNHINQESTDDIIDAARLPKGNYKDIKQALAHCFKTQQYNNKENNSKNTTELTKDDIFRNTPALSSTCMTISNCDTTKNDFIPPPPPPPILLLNSQQTMSAKPKKWNTVITDYEDSRPTDQGLHEKHPPPNEAASNLAKILKEHLLLPRRKELEQIEQLSGEKRCKTILPASPKTERTENPQPSAFPAHPKLFQPSSPVFRRQFSKENHVQHKIICSPTLSRRVQNGNHTLPRPSQSFARQQQKHPNDSINSCSTMEFNTTTVVPVDDPATKATKDNPNVRKLVYNTYRGLLGAYNNKANDIIATLPKNMVREDKGVSKQLESMALQGGLEKLNGRTNPNIEQE